MSKTLKSKEALKRYINRFTKKQLASILFEACVEKEHSDVESTFVPYNNMRGYIETWRDNAEVEATD